MKKKYSPFYERNFYKFIAAKQISNLKIKTPAADEKNDQIPGYTPHRMFPCRACQLMCRVRWQFTCPDFKALQAQQTSSEEMGDW